MMKMNRLIDRTLTCMVAMLGLSLFSALRAPSLAQAPRPGVRLAATDARREHASDADAKTHGANIRASQISGMVVVNEAGKSIGKVEDTVIDAMSGTVRYAAVSYGGFLGVGDKLFAVPWNALEFRAKSDGGHPVLVVDISEAELKAAPGFDQDHWPDFADRTLTDRFDAVYKVRRRIHAGNVEVDVNRGGVDVEVNGK